MEWKREWKPLMWIVAVFVSCYYLPVGSGRFDNAVIESLHLVKWYAQEHVLLCLIPAFFIAGAIARFASFSLVKRNPLKLFHGKVTKSEFFVPFEIQLLTVGADLSYEALRNNPQNTGGK